MAALKVCVCFLCILSLGGGGIFKCDIAEQVSFSGVVSLLDSFP